MKFGCPTCGTIVKEKEVLVCFDQWIHVGEERHQGYRKIYYLPKCPKCGSNIFDSNQRDKRAIRESEII